MFFHQNISNPQLATRTYCRWMSRSLHSSY